MRNRSPDWHIEIEGWPTIVLIIVLLPFALLFRLVMKLLEPWIPPGHDRTPAEVAGFIYDFIEGTGGNWDWDDFTSVPITDPQLEAIRQEADMIRLPLEPDGMLKLRELLSRARALNEKAP